jgi:hypothetical protein
MFSLHTARPFGLLCTGFLWPGHRLRFLGFSQRLIPSGFGETRYPRFFVVVVAVVSCGVSEGSIDGGSGV